jgi:hypothetical protein
MIRPRNTSMTTRIETEDVVAVAKAIAAEIDAIDDELQNTVNEQTRCEFRETASQRIARAALSATPIERLREENARVVTLANALIAKLDEAMPAVDRRPTIAELERILAVENSGTVEIKPDGSIHVAPREEIEALRAALTPSADDDK